MNKRRMLRLADVGERRAIEILRNVMDKRRGGDVAVGIGDDCAVIDIGREYLLVTTDMMTAGSHIPPGMTPFQIGWSVVAVNLSDIAAKGGRPLGLVTAFGLPRTASLDFVREVAEGMDSCAAEFGTSIIGGDTKEGKELTITGTALGTVSKKDIMLRTGAEVGDIAAVTGTLGRAGAGYWSMRHRLGLKKAERALLEPYPRVGEGIALAKSGVATSCMDISDGLASSIYQMSSMTRLGFEIERARLPIADEVMTACRLMGRAALADEFSLYYGGDYELLVTLRPGGFNRAHNALQRMGTALTPVGTVCKTKANMLIEKGGKKSVLENRGWQHFISRGVGR